MKKLILFLCLCSYFKSYAQTYTHIYYLDANFASTPQNEAQFLGKGFKENTLFTLDCFNPLSEKLFMQAHFSDSSLSNMQGLFTSYYENGKIENEGNYANNLETGLWQRWNQLGNNIDSSNYVDGKIMNFIKYSYDSNYMFRKETYDSITNKYQSIDFYRNGNVHFEAQFIDTIGTVIENDSLGKFISKKIVNSKDEVEATFPGGNVGFANFLRKTLNPLVPSNNNAPSGTYTVVIRFTVDEKGNVSNIYPETKNGYGTEKEALRVISNSGKWNPALRFGLPVKTYRRQPITFVVQDGER